MSGLVHAFLQVGEQLDDAIDDGFRAWRAAGDKDIHRDDFIDRAADVVAGVLRLVPRPPGGLRVRLGLLLEIIQGLQPLPAVEAEDAAVELVRPRSGQDGDDGARGGCDPLRPRRGSIPG